MAKKKRYKLKPWAFWSFFIIFLSLIIFSSSKLILWQKDNVKISKLEDEINNMTTIKESFDEGTLINPPEEETKETEAYVSDYWYYVHFPFYEIDFTNLIEKNSDTVAYIHMNNTNVNYPVVQTDNNEFYLTHAFDKKKNEAGWVYMDYQNTLEPMSDNIVLYGHGRVNNTVFGSLRKTLEENWQKNKDNFIINISTPTINYVYQIFSIYTIPAEGYYIKTNFTSIEEKKLWVEEMVRRNTSSYIETTANENDKILTLSTCYNDDGIRIVVQAKLIKTSA